jgi:hypothetical protein
MCVGSRWTSCLQVEYLPRISALYGPRLSDSCQCDKSRWCQVSVRKSVESPQHCDSRSVAGPPEITTTATPTLFLHYFTWPDVALFGYCCNLYAFFFRVDASLAFLCHPFGPFHPCCSGLAQSCSKAGLLLHSLSQNIGWLNKEDEALSTRRNVISGPSVYAELQFPTLGCGSGSPGIQSGTLTTLVIPRTPISFTGTHRLLGFMILWELPLTVFGLLLSEHP